ncbi:hypothetical protein [Streptomyces sp. NBC_01373]|uniref:hypothetical protein n=1 Tax=Streptomyces sp. NBC_01373 TaxID=2903843 RepID=UPI00224E7B5A|nr:hypothetical protein [Streptomyces sp. NBC_01373]MCX4698932.1 hypothetical protein [Streptomyces sp. NBC_01373]
MPRGRHRHSPPLHRILPPSAIAGVSLVCALGPWVFTEQTVLRGLAAAAAVTAVVGAVVMRHWDTQAGKQVADLTRARASDEWRYEERVAELETDLDESRELRVKLEQRLRAKRAELAGLRNEHAALLRRYATAETERASALEGRRLLEIEASGPARELLPAPAAPVAEAGAVAAPADPEVDETSEAEETEETAAAVPAAEDEPEAPAIFSPEGSKLFLRAQGALARFGDDGDGSVKAEPKNESKSEAKNDSKGVNKAGPKDAKKGEPVKVASAEATAAGAAGGTEAEAAQEDEAQGKPEAVDGHSRAAAVTTAKTAQPGRQSSGHFVAPTAVAVVPTTPARRPLVEGGFDFFGAQKGAAPAALAAVQNEDLADVVGQEALALHKAEAEAEFKPADEESRGVGQVIDLTAHDETEQIDVQGLRSAVS